MPASLPRHARGTVYGFLAPAATAAVACVYRDASGEAWRTAVERDFDVDAPAEEAAARYRELSGFRVVNGLQFRLFVEHDDERTAMHLDATTSGPWAVMLEVENVSDEQIEVQRRGAVSERLGVRRLSDGFEVLAREAPEVPSKVLRKKKLRLERLAPGECFCASVTVDIKPAKLMRLARRFRRDEWRGGPFDTVVVVRVAHQTHLIPTTGGDFELFLRFPGSESEGYWQGEYEGRLPVAWGAGAGE